MKFLNGNRKEDSRIFDPPCETVYFENGLFQGTNFKLLLNVYLSKQELDIIYKLAQILQNKI